MNIYIYICKYITVVPRQFPNESLVPLLSTASDMASSACTWLQAEAAEDICPLVLEWGNNWENHWKTTVET